jgi:hypothetical protein
MKKILFFLLISSNNLSSQTLEETKDWIITKFNYFKLQNTAHKDDILKIENGNIVLIKSSGFYEKISIKNIKQVSVNYYNNDGREEYSVYLFCSTNSKCSESGNSEDSNSEKIYNKFFNFYLDPSFKKDNYPERMEKAILELVRISGGKAQKHKEAF